MDELIRLYQEYIKLLSDSEASMIGIAYAHGYRVPDSLVKRGEELRTEIARLESSVNPLVS